MNLSKLDSQALLESLQVGVVVHAPSTEVLFANPKALHLLRLSEEQALGKVSFDPQWSFINAHYERMNVADYPVNLILSNRKIITDLEVGIVDSGSNEVTWVLCGGYPEFDSLSEIAFVVITFIDITNQKRTIPFEDIVRLANDVVVITEAAPLRNDGPKIVYVNEAFTSLTGYTSQEVIGKTPRLLQGDATDSSVREKIYSALNANEAVRETILNYSKTGEPYWLDMNIVPLKNAVGEITYFAAIERDVTEQKLREQSLHEQAINDPLTGLLNRRGFTDIANKLCTNAHRSGQTCCVAMLDIDHFKQINDTHGHHAGDLVLSQLAVIFKKSLRMSDIFGRLGGEEFALLLVNANRESAYKKLETLRKEIASAPFPISDNKVISITVSIGMHEIESDNTELSKALDCADKHLYRAKNAGRNQVSR